MEKLELDLIFMTHEQQEKKLIIELIEDKTKAKSLDLTISRVITRKKTVHWKNTF